MAVQQGVILKAVSTMDLPLAHVAQNVWYWKLVGVNPISDVDAMSTIVDGVHAFFTDVIASVENSVTLDDVIVHEWEYSAELGWHTGRFVGVSNLSVTFTGATEMLPHACAAVITAFTENVKKRSRKSVAGYSEATQTDSTWAGAVVTALVAAAAQWLSNLVILGSDQLQPGLPGKDGGWWPFIAMLVSAIVGSQRQRKPGVGI